MKKIKKIPEGGGENSHKTAKTASVLILTVVFALVLCGAASAGTPLQTNQTGTVSGDLYVNTTDGWPSSTQGATNEVTQANTLPTYTSIDSAWVYVNVYSGSGTNNWPVRTTVKLDGNGDGDYDDAGELLGTEDMNIPGSTDGTVYWLNDHCNRVYSDYQVWYDVTGLITSNNPTLYVKTESLGGDGYDGRIKLLALCVAYNDGDTDQVHYWVLNGQDWINSDTSPSTSTFNTSSFNGQVSSATLNTVALSGTDGAYNLNSNTLTGNLTETGAYYKEHHWDVTSNINSGVDTTLTYANVGGSFKMNLATLAIREEVVSGPKTWVVATDGTGDYTNIQDAIDAASPGDTIYVKAGTYNSYNIFVYKQNLNITGEGADKVIIAAEDEPGGDDLAGFIIGWKEQDDVQDVSGTQIQGVTFLSMIDLEFAQNVLIKDCIIPGIFGNMISSCAFQNNIFTDLFIIYGDCDENSDSNIIENNNFTNCPYGGLYLYATGGNIIRGNSFTNCSNEAIFISDQDVSGLQTNTFYLNNFTDNDVTVTSDGYIPDNTSWVSPIEVTYTYNGTTHTGIVGNYWGSDYNGIDANGDGIGDTNFTVPNGLGTDTAPLMGSWDNETNVITYTNTSGLADSAWPKIGQNLNNTGQSLYSGPSTNNVIWTYTTGDAIYSSPAIATDGTIYIGSYDGNLYALNSDGTLKWTYTVGSCVVSAPAIGADGTIYFGCDDFNFYALNADGTLKWTYTTGNLIENSPTIATDGTIYIGNYDGNLYALNPDGTLKWTYTTGTYILYGSPAIGTDGTIYIGSWDGNLYALNPDGTLKWSYTTGGAITFNPAIGTDGTIYFGSENYNLYALNPDGTLKWTYNTGNAIYGSPAIAANGTIYIGSDDGNLYALNPDGTLKWIYSTSSNIYGSPIISADGTIFIGCLNNNLYALNPDGTLKWIYAAGGAIYSFLAIGSDGTLYMGSEDGKLYTFNDAAASTPVADFTADNTSGYTPLTVHFTDTSTSEVPLTNWAWDFNNNGITDSTSRNPSWTFTVPGTYTVKLTVSNSGGSDDEVKVDFITVIADSNAPTVTANPTSQTLTAPIQVTLTATDIENPIPIIYYTTDGTDPTIISTLYTEPISISKTTALKFIAVDAAGNVSPVQSETYTDSQAPSVTANPVGSTLTSTTQVTLSATDDVDPNPTIYYTTDGTDPTTNSTAYIEPLSIIKTTALKFMAVDASGNTSPVQTETYTDSQAPSVTASPGSGTYTSRTDVTLSATDDVDPTPAIYYTTDGTDPTTSSTPYTVPISIPATTTLKFIAVDATGNTSAVQSETYTINDTEAPIVNTSLNGVAVTLTATDNVDPNPAIYYTTDGTDPTTNSTMYTGSFDIPRAETTTVKFFASDAAGNTSEVQTETLTGYYVKDLITSYYAEGNVGVIVSLGGTGYGGGDPTYELDLPAGATILSAHLCLGWTWYGYMPYTVTFNGNEVTNLIAHYPSYCGYTGLSDGNGQDVYDVTTYVINGTNTATIGHTGTSVDPYGRHADYGRVLIVVYQCDSEPYRQIWVNEGFHDLYYEGNTATAFFQNVTTDKVASAEILTMTPSGDSFDEENIILNGVTINRTSFGGSDPSFNYFNVTSEIQNGLNQLNVVKTSEGYYFALQNAILTVTQVTEPAADFAVDITSGASPLTVQFTDASSNTPTSWLWEYDMGSGWTTFASGTDTAAENPQYTFTSPGTYDIRLTVSNAAGSDDETKVGFITVHPAITNSRTGQVYTSIQDAINGALDGDTLTLQDGVYTENVTVGKQLTLNSMGAVTIQAANVGLPVFTVDIAGSGSTITGFVITGAINSSGICLESADSCNLINNVMSGNLVGVKFFDSDNNNLSGNTIQNNSWAGVCLDQSTGNTINNGNEVTGNQEGIFLANNSSQNTITGNNIHNNNGIGVSILSNSNSNTITGNTVSGNGVMGLLIQNSNSNTVSGNSVQNNGWAGICLDQATGNTISNANEVTGNQEGIFLANNSNQNIITGNNTYNNTGTGVSILNSNNNQILSNTTSSNGVMGIFIQNSNTNTLTGNTVENNGWAGIVLDNASGNTINTNIVTGNHEGVFLANNSNTNTLEGNQVDNNTGNGITVLNSNTNIIKNNQIKDNTYTAIFIQKSAGTIIQHNTLESNLCGVILDTAHDTIVYQNNFNSNTKQALASNGTGNTFYQGTTGNHYNNWILLPRPILGNENIYDSYPSTTPF